MAEEETAVGQKQLIGKFYFDNGAAYEGEWKYLDEKVDGVDTSRRVRHGKGDSPFVRIITHDRSSAGKYIEGGFSYEGDWQEDQMQGEGEFHFASGNTYTGEFKANAYHGKGRFTWTNGTSYAGMWQDGRMHGKGSYVDDKGRQWDGQFYNGSGPGLQCNV